MKPDRRFAKRLVFGEGEQTMKEKFFGIVMFMVLCFSLKAQLVDKTPAAVPVVPTV